MSTTTPTTTPETSPPPSPLTTTSEPVSSTPAELTEIAAATPDPPPGEPWVEVAQDDKGFWHWILWAANGKPLCRNAQVYREKKHCINALDALPVNWACVKIVARVS